MIGNVIASFVGYVKPPLDPDDYFDPTTHIATEANFIAFLKAGGKYDDTSLIGYKVTLSNSAAYNGGTYVIADVNHDSTNTGQTNCYDLISVDCFYNGIFGSDQNWRNSNPRTWLNNTFYSGFSNEFKNHILNPKYNSQGTWYTDDKIILPSKVEINGGTSITDSEGIVYPIFTGNNSRVKHNYDTARNWWTRSRNTNGSYVWYVQKGGTMSVAYSTSTDNLYLAPLMRVH